jgi:hypothetical protein
MDAPRFPRREPGTREPPGKAVSGRSHKKGDHEMDVWTGICVAGLSFLIVMLICYVLPRCFRWMKEKAKQD